MLPKVEKNDEGIFLDAHRLLWSRICLWLRNLDAPITVRDFEEYKKSTYINIANDMSIYGIEDRISTLNCCFLCDYDSLLSRIAKSYMSKNNSCDFCPTYIMTICTNNGRTGCLYGLYGALRKSIEEREYSDAYYIAVLIRDTPFCSFSKKNNKSDFEEIVDYVCLKGVLKNVNS